MSATRKLCLWAAALAAWAAMGWDAPIGADVVQVGRVRVEGRVVETGQTVTVYTEGGGRMTFPARAVDRIEYDVPTAAGAAEAAEAHAASAEPAGSLTSKDAGEGEIILSALPPMEAPWGGAVVWGAAAFPIRARGTALAVRNRALRLPAAYAEKRRPTTPDLVALIDGLARVPRSDEFPALRDLVAGRMQAAFWHSRKVDLWRLNLPDSLVVSDRETPPAGQAVLLVGMVGRWVERDGWDWGEFIDSHDNLALLLSRGQARAGGVRGIRTAIGGLFVGRTERSGVPVILTVAMVERDTEWAN